MSDKDFSEIAAFLARFELTSFADDARVAEYCAFFELKALMAMQPEDGVQTDEAGLYRSVSPAEHKPYEPKWHDLCRLHWLALSRRAVNILELGSGFSTIVLAAAARLLNDHFGGWVRENVRTENAFVVFSVDESAHFSSLTQRRMPTELRPYARIAASEVRLCEYEGRFATVYSDLPNVNADLIYLDGPSQFATEAQIDGFSLASAARMPMSADLLRVEFFLQPGTLIVIDGRTANARFLRAFFKRNWAYFHSKDSDTHYFELQEEPFGRRSAAKLDFSLGGKWLL
jgi:hypothetical protein